MKEEERLVHCFIAFFDVRGFGNFDRRVTDPETEILPWRRQYRKLIDAFEYETKYFIKRTGDGIVVFQETDPNDAWYDGVKFLDDCHKFMTDMKALNKKKRSPRPDGVRIRCVYGAVWQEPCRQLGKDYFGYKINLAERMLHQHKELCFVISESFKEQLKKSHCQKSGFCFKHLGLDPENQIDPIYESDMKLQWFFWKRNK